MLLTNKSCIVFCFVTLFGWMRLTSEASAQALPPGLPAQAQLAEGEALAKSKNCLGCHQLDTKRVGPALRSVAQRYAQVQDPQRYLENAIRQGGANRWGAVPMPAQPQVSAAEANLMADWILSLAVRN